MRKRYVISTLTDVASMCENEERTLRVFEILAIKASRFLCVNKTDRGQDTEVVERKDSKKSADQLEHKIS